MHWIHSKFDAKLCLWASNKCPKSARLKNTFASYSNFCTLCEKKNKRKQRNFFESLITRISGMVLGIFFKFEMQLPLSKGHLHSKFGAI